MKYAGLSQYQMERQLEIEQKYTNDLSKINKDVFSNKCEIKISIKGLLVIFASTFPGNLLEFILAWMIATTLVLLAIFLDQVT